MVAEVLIWVILLIAFVGSLTVTKALLTERRRNQLVFFSVMAIVLRELGDDISTPPILEIKISDALQDSATLLIISAIFLAYFLRLFSEGTSALSRFAAMPAEDKTFDSRAIANCVMSPFIIIIDVVGPLLITILALKGDIVGTIEVWREVSNYSINTLKLISIQGTDETTSSVILFLIDWVLQFLGTGIERVIGRFADITN